MKRTMIGVLAVASWLCLASGGQAQKMLCVSNVEFKGQETVASCLEKGERFAIVDRYGLVRILTPEEVELTRAFNPKAFETRAFGMQYQKDAPLLIPLPVSPEQQ